jgi:hypothetical protein
MLLLAVEGAERRLEMGLRAGLVHGHAALHVLELDDRRLAHVLEGGGGGHLVAAVVLAIPREPRLLHRDLGAVEAHRPEAQAAHPAEGIEDRDRRHRSDGERRPKRNGEA